MKRLVIVLCLLPVAALGASLASTSYPGLEDKFTEAESVTSGRCLPSDTVAFTNAAGPQCLHVMVWYSVPSNDGTVPAKTIDMDVVLSAADTAAVHEIIQRNALGAAAVKSTIPLKAGAQ